MRSTRTAALTLAGTLAALLVFGAVPALAQDQPVDDPAATVVTVVEEAPVVDTAVAPEPDEPIPMDDDPVPADEELPPRPEPVEPVADEQVAPDGEESVIAPAPGETIGIEDSEGGAWPLAAGIAGGVLLLGAALWAVRRAAGGYRHVAT